MNLRSLSITVLCVICLPVLLFSQARNFPVKNFSPKDYGMASSNNWSVVQDSNGFLYFGNANGVLQYDGREWRHIPVKYGTFVRAMVAGDNGEIYVGCYGQFGVLRSDRFGRMRYYSMSDSLSNLEANFSEIIKISKTREEVIFQSEERLFIFHNKNGLRTLNPETSFHTSFSVNNKFYVRQRKTGLLELKDGKLRYLEGSNIFANDGIFAMLPYEGEKLLIATMELGLFIYDPINRDAPITPLKTSNDNFLISSAVYGGILLSNGKYAFNTLASGVLILDKTGKIEHVVNKELGLRDDDVKQVIEDSHQNLWLAMNNGIAKVSLFSPLTYYTYEQGLTGSVNAILKKSNQLYVGTSNGLYYSPIEQSELFKFRKIENVPSNQVWELKEFDGKIIASSVSGVYIIEGANARNVFNLKARSVVHDPNNNIWLIGGENGLFVCESDWKPIKQVEHVRDVTYLCLNKTSLLKDQTEVWAASSQYGLYRILIDLSLDCQTDYIGGISEASHENIYPYEYDNNVILGTGSGLYNFDSNKRNGNAKGFSKIGLGENTNSPENVTVLKQFGDEVWMSANNKIEKLDLSKNLSLKKPFLAIDKGQIYTLEPDSNICWIGAADGLIRYNAKDQLDYERSFPLFVRKVVCNNDSVVFEGNATNETTDFVLPYQLNSLAFEYSANYFDEASRNQYSWQLKGNKDIWSKWTNETRTNFTNLHEGDYEFIVKARNIYGKECSPVSFRFTIAAPWYRSWWAYMTYVIAFVTIVLGFARARTQKLKQEKIKLEAIVKERTAEIIQQKDEIEKQKHLVDEQHKEITDSINYAQRIQHALLAGDRLMSKHLQDHFVFFQPRNVVSGDFYWAAELSNGKFALVTADSTGHGVPGAIMSILNISCLNDAVEADKQTEPGEILNYTRKRIIQHLANDGSAEGGKDGMDCSIVCYDFIKKEITYSAANNPVWIIRRNNQIPELIELSPDKMPVGKHDKDHISFSTNTFPVQPGDLVYAFTDGIPDQFGGPKGKKFKYKQLADLLLEVSGLTMSEQKQTIQERFGAWKDGFEQTDDVCLIGIRIT